jgi:hypothetical protein
MLSYEKIGVTAVQLISTSDSTETDSTTEKSMNTPKKSFVKNCDFSVLIIYKYVSGQLFFQQSKQAHSNAQCTTLFIDKQKAS